MAANSITNSEARRLYKRQAPTHGRSKQHKEDIETISKASSPVAKAETLIAQRRTQSIDKRIEEMLQDHQCVFHDMWPPVPRACGQSFHDMWPHP